jgi:hypothetical protein
MYTMGVIDMVQFKNVCISYKLYIFYVSLSMF